MWSEIQCYLGALLTAEGTRNLQGEGNEGGIKFLPFNNVVSSPAQGKVVGGLALTEPAWSKKVRSQKSSEVSKDKSYAGARARQSN